MSKSKNELEIMENYEFKMLRSKDYNYTFNKQNGQFVRHGRRIQDDPNYSVFGAEIIDIEVTTICKGISTQGVCDFCYKGNTACGKNMSLETFKKVFDNLPKTICQAAFGVDSHAESNPELWDMMQYCLLKGIIPNITVAEVSTAVAKKIIDNVGAVAVSYYDLDVMMTTINRLVTADIKDLKARLGGGFNQQSYNKHKKQINVHAMICEETFDKTMQLLQLRASGLNRTVNAVNAFVLLSLKQKGRGKNLTPLSQEKFKELVDYAVSKNIPIGFDSCSAFKFLKAVEGHPNYKMFEQNAEPCESTCFSMYVNVDGKFFPCSFTEGEDDWDGIDMTKIDNFIKEVWNNSKVVEYRNKILKCRKQCKNCFHFNV